MTSGGNNLNDFPENQLAQFQLGDKNITILRTFWGLDTGRPGKYGTIDNPKRWWTCRRLYRIRLSRSGISSPDEFLVSYLKHRQICSNRLRFVGVIFESM